MFRCDRFLLDISCISLLSEREVYSKENQKKSRKYTKLENNFYNTEIVVVIFCYVLYHVSFVIVKFILSCLKYMAK